jgi:hypothetical protein
MRKVRWLRLYHLPVLLAPLILLAPIIFSGKVLFWGTPALQFIPWRSLAFESLKQGNLPLWNPFNGMGAPLAANYQVAVFYPPGWLLFLAQAIGGVPWMAWAYTILAALHLAWAGLGMAKLSERLGYSPVAQVIGGISFSLSGYFIARLGFFSMIWAGAWLPWILYAASSLVHPGINREQEIHSTFPFFLSFCIGMQLLAGHAQLSWYTMILAAAWVLVGVLQLHNRRKAWKVISKLALAGELGILLASVQLLLTGEYLLQSQRAAAVDFEMAMTYSFWPWRFLSLLAPDLFGNPGSGNYWGYASYWEDAIYLGVLPFLLALSTIPLLWKRRSADSVRNNQKALVIFLWALGVVSALLALGKNTPIFPFLYHYIPTFDMFNAPARYMIWLVFALSLLAGIGYESWKKPFGRSLYWTRLATAGGFAITLGAFIAWYFLSDIELSFIKATALCGLWALGSGFLTLWNQRESIGAKQFLWNGAVVLWVCVDLLVADLNANPVVSMGFYDTSSVDHTALSSQLVGQRTYLNADDEYFLKFKRFLRFEDYSPQEDWANLRYVLLPNTNLLENISSTNNFDPLLTGRYSQWMNYINTLNINQITPWLQVMDVGAVEVRDRSSENQVRFEPVVGGNRFWWSSCSKVSKPGESAWNAFVGMMAGMQGQFNPHTVLLEGVPAAEGVCGDGGEVTIDIGKQTLDSLALSVQAPGHGWLVISDTWYPGWQVRVDGKKASLVRANYLFKAVELDAGKHSIQIVYRPYSFSIGLGLTLLSWIVLFVGIFLHLKRKSTSRISDKV